MAASAPAPLYDPAPMLGTETDSPAATRPAPARRVGPRLFATTAEVPRARRASDVISLVAAGFGLALTGFADEPPSGFARSLSSFVAALPHALDGLWQAFADVLVVLAVVLLAAAVLRRRYAIARDIVIAVAVAAALSLVAGRLVEGSWPALWDALRTADPPPWFPSSRLALPTAAVITASPHVSLPVRRLGRRLVALAAFGVMVLGAATPLGAIGAVLVATMAAAAVHLAFGSTEGRTSLGLVRDALVEVGVPVRALGAADRQQAGLFRVDATAEDGDQLVVKVYGRDAHDTALVRSVWRTIWYRGADTSWTFGRRQQVEHEAFLTLLANQADIPTDAVVTAGATADDDMLLVLRREGRLLDDGAAGREGRDRRDVVADLWALLGRLHDAGIAHGQVDPGRLLLTPEGRLGIVDFRGAAIRATDAEVRIDEVQALVTSVLLAGQDEAVASALAALGPEGLATVLPYLQPSVLTPRHRRQIDEADIDLDELREAAAAAVGEEPPELQQLRRITIGSVIRVVLPALAVIAVLSAAAGLDADEAADLFGDATWWLLAVAAVVCQVPRLFQAVATLGAAPVPLPLGPVYALQLAVSYVNLAIPSAAGRIAVTIRFFQRHGVGAGPALAAGALDSVAGFVVQIALLVGLLTLTSASLDLDVGQAASSAASILALVVALAAVALVVVLAVRRMRTFVVGWTKRLASEALTAVRRLRSPRRVAMLLGGNLGSEVLFASALALFATALGYPIGLAEALVVNVGVSLFSGIMPVPGGIGVAEGALTFGLVQLGLPQEVALATALAYRAASFYLPPAWGWFAMRWLERNGHL
jgi:uncharacterized membrane protein YbhN (UPF0104 family)